jgi:hypothetical protein
MYVNAAYLHETAQMAGTSSWDAIMLTRNLPKKSHERTPIAADADIYVMTKLTTQYNDIMNTSGLAVYNSAHTVPMAPNVEPILIAHANTS